MADEKLELGLDLENYRYDARHYPAQGHARWIDYNYIRGVDFPRAVHLGNTKGLMLTVLPANAILSTSCCLAIWTTPHPRFVK